MAGPLREVYARFSIEVDAQKLDNLNKKVNEGSVNLRKFLSGAAGAIGLGAIGKFIGHVAEMGDKIADTSERLGISSDALQALEHRTV
jgi:hypothetical protein